MNVKERWILIKWLEEKCCYKKERNDNLEVENENKETKSWRNGIKLPLLFFKKDLFEYLFTKGPFQSSSHSNK